MNLAYRDIRHGLGRFVLTCLGLGLLLGVVLRGTRDSILAVALMHTVFNRSNNDEGVVAGLLEGQAHGLAGLLAVILLATIVAILARHRLNRAYRAHLDTSKW